MPSELQTDAPQWMSEITPDQQAEGVDKLSSHQQLSWLKIMQYMTNPELRDEHGQGSIVITPENLTVADAGTTISVVPCYFWPEFQKRADPRDKSAWIIETSTDTKSDVASKCRIPRYTESYQQGSESYEYSYITSLNFYFEIRSGAATGMAGVLPFSKGSYKIGTQIQSHLRRTSQQYGAPLFSNLLDLKTVELKGGRGSYWAPQYSVPETKFVQSRADVDRLREVYRAVDAQFTASIPKSGHKKKSSDENTYDDIPF